MAVTTLAGVIDAGVYVIGYYPTGQDVGADFTAVISKLNENITLTNTNETAIGDNVSAQGIINLSVAALIGANGVLIADNADDIANINMTATEHASSGNFSVSATSEPTVVADDSTIQNCTLFDPASFPDFTEGTRRIIICDNEAGITVTCTAWAHEPPVYAGAGVPLRPGQRMMLTTVGSSGSEKWEFHIDRGDDRPQWLTLTTDLTLDLRQGHMVINGDGASDVFLPAISAAVVGHKATITRQVVTFAIKPTGNDIFLGATTASATPGAYDTYTFIATNIDSGTGGFKWTRSLSTDE